MTARSLINLILKILGLFFIKDILDALSRTISVLIYFRQYSSSNEAWYNLGVTLPSLVLFSFFVWMLLFRTNSIISLLGLDKDTGEMIVPFRLHRSVVLAIAIVAAGGWLVASGIPELIRQLVYYYQERKLYTRMAKPDLSYIAMAMGKLLVGIFMISFNRGIGNMIELKRRTQGPWYWPARVPFSKKKKKLV